MNYIELVELYEKISKTSKRLEKTHYVSKLLKKTPIQELEDLILLIRGKIYPEWDEKKIGVSSKLVIKAINKTTGVSDKEIEENWKKLGDLGDVARHLLSQKRQESLFKRDLIVKEVIKSFRKLSDQQGLGSVDQKLSIISELLVNATPLEAKYISRTLVDNLRVGVGKGVIRDAIIWTYLGGEIDIKYDFEKNDIELDTNDREKYNEILKKIQHAYDITNDFGLVAKTLKFEGLNGISKLKMEVGKPINVMLFPKAKDVNDAFDIVGKPAAFEYKYDGFRTQIHKTGDIVTLFSRRFENVTLQFPEIVKAVKKNVKAEECILDAEAVGIDPKTGKNLPFQKISQRIKRKYDIEKIAKQFPVELNIFDILSYKGESLLQTKFKKRREILNAIVEEEEKSIVLAKQLITNDEKKAQEFYAKALKNGEEGVMVKSLEGIYKPGARVGYGVKLKSIMEPLDLVIVAGEYGEGKRSGYLTSFYLACEDNGELREIGKVSTGLKELEEEGITFKKMTELIMPLVSKNEGKFVKIKPQIVIEVGYEEIQKSINYDSGFALRFPRFLRLRIDEKEVEDINTIDDIEMLYNQQRGK